MAYYTGYSDEPPHGGGGGDDGGLIGAIIQTGGALYDSHQNRKLSRENVDKTIAAQKAEAELAYQRSVEMWNKQNLYNSPQMQMQRFIAAGLNPHLIYGQGNPGNSSGTPQYHPADIQYKYESGNFGAAIQQLLPTLMAVGTWMQNMRMSEAELKSKQVQQMRGMTETERAKQMIDYLEQRNPKALAQLENELNLFPYQRELGKSVAEKAWRTVADMEREYQHKWGEQLFDSSGMFDSTRFSGRGDGMRKLQFVEQQSKNTSQYYKNKLLEAQSSWTDLNLTNPQAIVQMVLGGVLGMAGQQLRLSTQRSPRAIHEVENRMSTGRTQIRRRIYER